MIRYVNYEELRSGQIEVEGNKVEVGSMSSYYKALEIANLLAEEIRRGEFLVSRPIRAAATQYENETIGDKREIVSEKFEVWFLICESEINHQTSHLKLGI